PGHHDHAARGLHVDVAGVLTLVVDPLQPDAAREAELLRGLARLVDGPVGVGRPGERGCGQDGEHRREPSHRSNNPAGTIWLTGSPATDTVAACVCTSLATAGDTGWGRGVDRTATATAAAAPAATAPTA